MSPDDRKRSAAQAALDLIPHGCILGVGTGTTVDFLVDALATERGKALALKGAVSSSERSAKRLRAIGIEVIALETLDDELPVYVDGADEVTAAFDMIKGGGGALTREKIVAAASKTFVCIADQSKLVETLGAFPLAIEVIPMARTYLARKLVEKGGNPKLREGFVTDNGNVILDVLGLDFTDPRRLETELDGLVGVVTCGIFAKRGADILLLGGDNGVETTRRARA